LKQVKCLNVWVALILVLASACAAATEFRIGLVDKQVLSQESLYAKNVHERMKKEFSARQDSLITKEKDLMTKYEALERDKDVIAESERIKREKELVKLQQKLKDESEAFQADVMARQEKESAAFEKLVTEVLAQIAKEEKLDLVLQQQVALFNGGKSDYTYKSLQALDKLYKESNKK
jgi:Skp family chaperone for outer membrane proteins